MIADRKLGDHDGYHGVLRTTDTTSFKKHSEKSPPQMILVAGFGQAGSPPIWHESYRKFVGGFEISTIS